MSIRAAGLVAISVLGILTLGSSQAAEAPTYASNKNFDELTPAEKNLAKATAREKKLEALRVCADPGNMPLSDAKGEGFENKIVQVLAKTMDTSVVYFWRPYMERGLTSDTFGNQECDVLLDMPADYEGLLTTTPIYRTTYIFAYRTDSGVDILSLDDPKLKQLRIGVFQHSGLRVVLAKHGVIENVKIHVISYDADLEPDKQPWRQVQEVVDGKLDIAGVWGPFAGYLVKQGAPLTLQPVNLMEDQVPLEFDLALAVRRNDVVLKYMLDNALEKSKEEIKKILTDYGVPLVQCSRCVVSGELPSHGSFATNMQEQARKRFLEPLAAERTELNKAQASPDQVVDSDRVDAWLKEGADLNQEFTNAVLASDHERVAALLDKGADINKRNLQGFTPLQVAARQRDSDMMAILINHHADVSERDSDGWTALLHAVLRNHVPSIQVLLANGAGIEETAPGGITPLSIAISEGKFFAAKALIEKGANVNAPAGSDRLTPLMLIVSQRQVERRAASLSQGPGSVELAQLLIAQGADVNATSSKGVTPLMVAAAHDNAAVIAVLVQAGAKVDAKTPDGKSALDIAKDNGSDEVLKVLAMFAQGGASGAPSVAASPGEAQPEQGQ